MNKTSGTLSNLSVTRFDLTNHKRAGYSFFAVSENSLKTTTLKNHESEELSLFFKENNVISVGLIKTIHLPSVEKELENIQQKIDFEKSHFAVLVQYEDPNIFRNQTNLPPIESFLISSNEFVRFYEKDISTGLCYHFMLQALNAENQLEQIIAHQIGHPQPIVFKQKEQPDSTEVIMPHHGNLDDLDAAIWYLKKQKNAPRKISVCFDEFVTDRHFKMADKNSEIRFFANYPPQVGPYPSREILARATEEEIIVFHDSDDVSTTDRVSVLTHVLNNENVDAVGSHELRVNKIEKRIEAVRFPLDVAERMSKEVRFSIFFPTTAIKKSAYLKSGGLSTVRKHSSDSQFYRRAFFFMNLKNVDEFLYIRVKRENSLTTAKRTTLGSPVRERLKKQWVDDFIRIQNRNISLNESTLIDESSVTKVDLIPIKKEYREAILTRQELTRFFQKENPFNHIPEPDFPDENDILESRLLPYNLVKDPGVKILKQSLSWRIGYAITRVIIVLFGWIPFIKKRL